MSNSLSAISWLCAINWLCARTPRTRRCVRARVRTRACASVRVRVSNCLCMSVHWLDLEADASRVTRQAKSLRGGHQAISLTYLHYGEIESKARDAPLLAIAQYAAQAPSVPRCWTLKDWLAQTKSTLCRSLCRLLGRFNNLRIVLYTHRRAQR